MRGWEDLRGSAILPTEDLALVRALCDREVRMAIPVEKDLAVTTRGLLSFSAYVAQRKRWLRGFHHVRFSGKAVMAVAALRHTAILVGILTGSLPALTVWFITALLNGLILSHTTAQLGLSKLMKGFLAWEILTLGILPILALSLLFKPVVIWKDRHLQPVGCTNPKS